MTDAHDDDASGLQVDFDRDLWLYVPAEWPWEQFGTLEDWSSAIVTSLTDAYGYDAPMQEWVRATVEGMSRGVGEYEYRFGYLSRPHEALGMASIYELPAGTGASLDDLLGLPADDAVRPVIVEPFEGGRLGAGVTATRHDVDADGSISAVTHWVWRTPVADVVMIAGDPDPGRFATLRDDYDSLARAIGVGS